MELVGGLAQVLAAKRDLRQAEAAGKAEREAAKTAEQERYQALAQALSGGGDPSQALIASGDPDFMKMGISHMLAPKPEPKDTRTPLQKDYEWAFDQSVGPDEAQARQATFGKKYAKGMQIVTNPDGTISIATEGQELPTLTKTNVTRVQEKQIQTEAARNRLQGIKDAFNPEFATRRYAAGMRILEERDKLGFDFADLNPEQQQALADYSDWKAQTYNNLNGLLHELSGAAVNQHEFERLKNAIPNPDDSPTTFSQKLETAIVIAEDIIQQSQNRLQGESQQQTIPDINETMSTSEPAVNFQGQQYILD